MVKLPKEVKYIYYLKRNDQGVKQKVPQCGGWAGVVTNKYFLPQ
jgi:hypothetical protein